MLTKKQGKLNTLMSIMLMTKIAPDIRIWDLSTLNLVSLYVEKIYSEKINYMQINVYNKANYFCLKTKFYQKGNFQNFWLHALIFFTKIDFLYNADFQSLFSLMIRICELYFWPVGIYFSRKLLCLQRKTAPLLSRS